MILHMKWCHIESDRAPQYYPTANWWTGVRNRCLVVATTKEACETGMAEAAKCVVIAA